VQLTGTGVTVKLNNIPTGGARVQITVPGTTMPYCAALTATTNGTEIPWASFNTKCYDTPADGTALTAAPMATNVQVQVVAVAAAGTFDFCIEQVKVTTM
jgi:hypothetical protein